MQVKRYVASTFAEALIQAKNDLGPEALIVESKKVRRGGFFGLFGQMVTEVTAAVERGAPYATTTGVEARVPHLTHSGVTPTPSWPPQLPPVRPVRPTFSEPSALSALHGELAGLRKLVTQLVDRSGPSDKAKELSGIGRRVYEGLVDKGALEDVAVAVATKVQTASVQSGYGPEVVRAELTDFIGPTSPITAQAGKRKVVALVGPTGVGKTTTIAKLAARFHLEQGLKVGLITSDTFRIAAIEQLRTYADILGIPFFAVDTPAEVAQALLKTADCDLILADTSGRNHRNPERMRELRELLATLRPDETHLVLSLTASSADAMSAIEAYLPLGVNRVALTKLDEAARPGLILNLRSRCDHPISYLTTGQSVPDDLTPADEADFAKILLGA